MRIFDLKKKRLSIFAIVEGLDSLEMWSLMKKQAVLHI